MGFSENGSKRAAIAVQNSSGEAAMEWVFACRSAVKRGPSLYTYEAYIRPSGKGSPACSASPGRARLHGVGGVHPAPNVPRDRLLG